MGSDSTSKWGLGYPAATDPTNVPGDIEQPIAEIDALLSPVQQGTLASRSAAGKQGRWYQATDGGNYGYMYQDTGSNWIAIGVVNSTVNSGVGSAGLVSTVTPGLSAAQGSSALAAAADHVHAAPAWGGSPNIKPLAAAAAAGSSGLFADAAHVHPGSQVGDVTWSFATSPSSSQLLANGQAVSQATYPALYALATAQSWPQNSPGVGNFNIINLQGVSPIGAGTGYTLGQPYGATTAALSTANIPAHNHSATAAVYDPGHYHDVAPVQFVVTATTGPFQVVGQSFGSSQYVTFTTKTQDTIPNPGYGSNPTGIEVGVSTGNTGSGTAFSILQPVVAMNPFIKAL